MTEDRSAAQGRCGRVVDPGAAYPHPCVLPEGHDPPCDGRSPEARSAADALVAENERLRAGYQEIIATNRDGAARDIAWKALRG